MTPPSIANSWYPFQSAIVHPASRKAPSSKVAAPRISRRRVGRPIVIKVLTASSLGRAPAREGPSPVRPDRGRPPPRVGRLPSERSCLSLVWAVLDRASRGWRGVQQTISSIRVLAELRRELFDPVTTDDEEMIDEPVTPAA